MSTKLLKECLRALKSALEPPRGVTEVFDETKAQELFQALHVEGERLAFDTVKAVALETGWSEPLATKMAELAQKIGTGRRVITWDQRNWGVPTVAKIKEQLAQAGTSTER